MALARIGNARRVENFTWPGFVDALATLLMVIIFVLMVFVLIQVNLAYRVSGQDATLGEMRQQLASLGELLNIERRASADLAANLAQITNQLNTSNANRDELQAQLASVQAAIAVRNNEIARLAAKQADSEAALAAARSSLEERLGALQLAEGQLAMAQAQNQSAANKIDALHAETTASKAQIAQMTGALAALRLRLEELTSLLAEKDRQATRDKVAIASLGRSLNNALASRVQELQRFRSEFFGRLRDVLKGRDDVQIVGDRFVFQSEVLFAQGQAEIAAEGQDQLAKLAITLADIATKIPEDINWVLQVDGHTDDVPIRAGRYADNWDLSTERALSVVRFLNQQGLPANRLAAAGYGEFQPLDATDNDDARRKNRRIELKITQRVAVK
ncbi:peptidoglycan-binding protein [Alphaproteobacteria bacterium]|jgi:chemotaxis protein MotB|nr:peptidoglycan-binding protein [Alphaproteobacteria bacterium]MDB0014313.1 peptidoglycan-binding protein [Alphaproteobacteria bacterium]MDB4147629.1 peptidoglycan-binding protein [Alphaproteobacteria bacterium]MDG2489647.1 peptidoglycan-binding protein [Alphaproteobacteria bacterium]HBV78163.1 flagellar motor protein [Alphaproteobacteria bacterium]